MSFAAHLMAQMSAEMSFTDHLIALLGAVPRKYADDAERRADSLFPRDLHAFRRAMLPALRLCVGADADAPRAYFAYACGWFEPGQAEALGFKPRAADVDEEGRVRLAWLISCDTKHAFDAFADDLFSDNINEMNAALPDGVNMDDAPEASDIYGVFPAACAPFLQLLHACPYASDPNATGIAHVHLVGDSKRDAAAATVAKRARTDADA